MRKLLTKLLVLGMVMALVIATIPAYGLQEGASAATTDKPEKPTIKTYTNGPGTGTGYMDISWKAMPGATNYKIVISNGYNYEYFTTGNVTTWSTKGKKIFPTQAEISQGLYKFHTDGKGVEFATDPRALYENGYKAGSTHGLRNQQKYIVGVIPVYSTTDGVRSDIVDAYLPPIEKPNKAVIKTNSNGLGTGTGSIDFTWDAMPGAINYKVVISNGYNYEYFTTGNTTKWSTKDKKIYPTQAEINQGKYKFHTDGKGTEFAADPRSLYEVGYAAGSTHGLKDQKKYITRLIAVYPWGDGPAADIVNAYMPPETPANKPDSPLIKTTLNEQDEDTGYIDVSWKAVPEAVGYKVVISNGYNYEYFTTGNVTTWSTKGRGIFPTQAEIDNGKYKFHTDGKGDEFAVDPRDLYENGYLAGSTHGLRNEMKYLVRVLPIYLWGDGQASNITEAYMPESKSLISEYDEIAEEYGYKRETNTAIDVERQIIENVDLEEFKAELEAERQAELEISQEGEEVVESFDSEEAASDVESQELDENGLPVVDDDNISDGLLRSSKVTKTYKGTEKMPVFGFVSKLTKYAKVTRSSGKVTKVSVWGEVSGFNYPVQLEVVSTWYSLNNGKKNGTASYRVKKYKYIIPGLPGIGWVSYNTATLKF